MNGLLIRVAADQSEGGGFWNSPADSKTGQFVYTAIPESSSMLHAGLSKPYAALHAPLRNLQTSLPAHLSTKNMHLDPDFNHLTYGDQGQRAKQIKDKIETGDLLVFYSGMRDIWPPKQLIYGIIGLYIVEEIIDAVSVPDIRRNENAHTRRILSADAKDIVVRARREGSGRLQRYIPIGDYRDRAYRVWPELLATWGGLNVRNGYLQRSARLPEFTNTQKFYAWILAQNIPLIARNNFE